mgnify:FL=1
MRVQDFVVDAKGFVDPIKLVAVDTYGLDKAIEMYKNGGPAPVIKRYLIDTAFRPAHLMVGGKNG